MRGAIVLLLMLTVGRAQGADHVPLYRFYDTELHQHQYTTSDEELEEWRADEALREEGIIGWVPAEPGDDENIVRLYRALSKTNGRTYYYRVKPRGLKNFELVGPPIYVYLRDAGERIPIHACCLVGGEDMLFSQSRDEIERAVESTRNAIGERRRVFYEAFYVLPEDPDAPTDGDAPDESSQRQDQ